MKSIKEILQRIGIFKEVQKRKQKGRKLILNPRHKKRLAEQLSMPITQN